MKSKNYFEIDGQAIASNENETVLQRVLAAEIDIGHSCGGMGTCGTCRVIVHSGLEKLPVRNAIEAELAGSYHYSENERLACQIPAIAGLKLSVPN